MFIIRSLVLLVAAVLAVPAVALELEAESYIVAHPDTGTVVIEHNADEELAPASLAKMMTLYMLFDAMEQGIVNKDSKLLVSEKAWKKGGSKMFVEVDKKIKVEDLIKGIAISSGNDACIVVAEHLGGTEEAFADMMTAKARELGMQNTVFKNASGWPHPEQHTTARDMYILAKHLQEDFPEHYDTFSQTEFTFNDIRQFNRNGLLRRDIGIDGMKTGHIEEVGYHLVASAKRNGVRLISVVMGTDSMDAREGETLKAFNYVYNTHQPVEPVTAGDVLQKPAPVKYGKVDKVTLVAAENLDLFLPRRLKHTVKSQLEVGELVAPIAKGQTVGRIHVKAGEKDYDVPVIAAHEVPKAGIVKRIKQKIKEKIGL